MNGRPTCRGTSVTSPRVLLATRTSMLAAAISGVLLTAATPASGAESAIEEIIVTAQRRAENLQDVPLAVSAFTAGDLERAGVRQAGDVAAMVPNFTVASPYGAEAMPVFSLRGVTSNDFSQNQSAPVAMYVDDVYKSVGALQALQTFDLDRVEVLRGPQGTLYGKNATGGAISFFSHNPDLHAYDGYATAGLGNFSAKSFEGAAGGPIVDGKLGWRAAVYYDKRDGWMDSITPGVAPANGVDALAGRLSLLAKPTDDLTATLKFSFSRSRGTPYGIRPANILPDVTGSNPNIGFFQNAALYAYGKVIDSDSLSLKLDWQIASHAILTSVTAFDFGRWVEVGDDASVGSNIWGADTYASSVNAYSQELRIASLDTGAWTWLAGAYLGHDAVHGWNEFHYFDGFPGTILVPGSSAPLYGFDQKNSFNQIRQSSAVFANVTFDVSPTITLRGGLRYTRDRLSLNDFYALEGGVNGAPTFAGLGQPVLWTQTIPYSSSTWVYFQPGTSPQGPTLPEQSVGNTNLSYKFGADWKPTSGVMTYVSISRGYRGAALNSQAFNDPSEVNFAKPEELTSYEIGLKSELFERRMQLNAAVFYYNYKNQQFLGTSTANGVLLYSEVNANSKVKGGEIELRAKATQDLELRANIGIQDSKYVDFLFHGTDVSGNQLASSPKMTATGAVDWRVGNLFGGTFRLGADVAYTAKQYFDPQDTERIAQGGYTLVNARATLQLGSASQYSISLWGKNLGNKGYISYALATQLPSQGGLGLDYTVPAEPRTFGLTGSVHF